MADLFASDIARMRGISREAASRFLRHLEEKYGPSVVGRYGNARYTTRAALRKVGPEWIDGIDQEPLRDKLKELEGRVAELEMRLARRYAFLGRA